MKLRLTLQKKLLLASTSLLIIPWIGYQYILEMQAYLQSSMEQNLLSKVKLIAASLHNRPELFKTINPTSTHADKPITPKQHLYVRPIQSRIKLDGYNDDWQSIKNKIHHYSHQNEILSPGKTNNSFSMQLGSKKNALYVFFKVNDKTLIFRNNNSLHVDRSDHLLILMQGKDGRLKKYIVTAKKSGWVNAYQIFSDNSTSPEIRIKGSWQRTKNGYNLELKIPTYIIGEKLSFAIADVDDTINRQVESIIATSKIDSLEKLGTIVVPSVSVENLLTRVKQDSSRIWVINNAFHVIALSDQLVNDNIPLPPNTVNQPASDRSFLSGLMHLLYRQILRQPVSKFQDDRSTTSQLNTHEIYRALKGNPATSWRTSPDNRVFLLTATHPIYLYGNVVGAVAIEETSNNILLLQNQAIEILINLSILTFSIAFFILLIISIRLSSRIRKLRDQADKAITSDGKVVSDIDRSSSQDEIGDLSRSTSAMLSRISQYHRYLESMASKLAHELRTPITIIRSSIENMNTSNEQDRDIYIKRASSGIKRLNNILTRMSEASRLEQTIQTEEVEKFEIAQLITACAEGYQQAHPKIHYQLENNLQQPVLINGSPDLIAQLLDKLISNANDFSLPDTKIIIRLKRDNLNLVLQVLNQGEALKDEMFSHLFDSMVSLRTEKTDEPHLGLGLHIVKLITDFHKGQVSAFNLDNNWVCFQITLPIAS